MSGDMMVFRCHGCGVKVDAGTSLPFRCPNAGRPGDDTDHVLAVDETATTPPSGSESNPFLRYRALLSPYRLARAAGLSDAAWTDIVAGLDAALIAVDGRGFRITPMQDEPRLARALGRTGRVWVKDETGNVAGSHKARHLMGVLLYLRVLELARLPAGKDLRARRLAIASCGNAALAAAVVARAADWPLDVFIPPEVDPVVKKILQGFGAGMTICERRSGEAGDPCFLRFREAVARGAIPFGVQCPENGLAIEGGRTLALEMAQGFGGVVAPDRLFVQVGGGALASALAQGFALARGLGLVSGLPKLMAVQAARCAPLARAWQRLTSLDLGEAAHHRSRFMWPWETAPVSLASGILDDETYDWWAVAEGMRASGGAPIVVDEDVLAAARDAAHNHTGIRVSATGASGLAGAMALAADGGDIAVVFSGVER